MFHKYISLLSSQTQEGIFAFPLSIKGEAQRDICSCFSKSLLNNLTESSMLGGSFHFLSNLLQSTSSLCLPHSNSLLFKSVHSSLGRHRFNSFSYHWVPCSLETLGSRDFQDYTLSHLFPDVHSYFRSFIGSSPFSPYASRNKHMFCCGHRPTLCHLYFKTALPLFHKPAHFYLYFGVLYLGQVV